MKNLFLILVTIVTVFSCQKDEVITPSDKGMNIQSGVFNGQILLIDSLGTTLNENLQLTLAKDIVNHYYIVGVLNKTFYPKLIEIDNDLIITLENKGFNLSEDGRELTFKVNDGENYIHFKGVRRLDF
jgi:hypothetical protein